MSLELYQLIKSLSRSEKRKFKLSVNSSSVPPAYLFLYKIYNGLEEYDKDSLKQKIEAQSNFKNPEVVKIQLKQNILKVLRNLDKTSIEQKINTELHDALLLKEKGLYEHSLKILKSANGIAIKYEKYTQLIKILKATGRIVMRMDKRICEIDGIHKEIKKYIQILAEEVKFENWMQQVFAMKRLSSVSYLPERKIEINTLFEKIKSSEIPESFFAKKSYLYCLALFYESQGDSIEYINHLEQIVKLWESHDHFRIEYPKDYKIAISNYLSACNSVKRYDTFEEYLSKIRTLSYKQSEDEKIETYSLITYLEILYFINTGQFKTAKSKVNEIKEKLELYKDKIVKPRLLSFYYAFGCLFFITHNFSQALNWVEKLIDDEASEVKEELRKFALVMRLMIHFEFHLKTNNDRQMLLDSFIRSIKRGNKDYKFGILVVKFINSLLKVKHPFPSHCKSFLEKLTDYKQNQTKAIEGYDLVKLWVGAKIKGLKMDNFLIDELR